MSSRIIRAYFSDYNPAADESCTGTCESCAHWHIDRNASVYARIGSRRVQVGQCLCGDDDRAPYVDTCGAESVVFTQAETTCPAYEIHPECLAEAESWLAHYAELDNQLTRDAWM